MQSDKDKASFTTDAGFCADCGSILPLLTRLSKKVGVTCYACNRKWSSAVYGNMAMHHKIYFNTKYSYDPDNEKNAAGKNVAEGPIVDRRCSQCNNNKMSYATLQLRSADEGQTVFYTCTKCKFKETENS